MTLFTFDEHTIMNVLGVTSVVGAAWVVMRSATTRSTITQQKTLISTYEQRVKALEDQHIENVKAIADMQGQIKVYKELPLEKIANSIAQIAKTNESILSLLNERNQDELH